ncbi:unnamed protein product [Mytilus edulis]|uniref:Uncharacterized protein n=1 Tax=Mytilus edulis TaxID=6550 RepID=A0A8S3VCI6_MYTED|nr:unnamed protein product [Mytilus edulis]
MSKSIRDLCESIYTQRSEQSAEMTTSLNNLTTIPLMVEYISSHIFELKSRNSHTMVVENERLLTIIKDLEKQILEAKESLRNHQTVLEENEHLHTQVEILEKQLKDMKESLGNHETILVENERMHTKIKDLEKQKTEMKEYFGNTTADLEKHVHIQTKIEAQIDELKTSYKSDRAEKEKLEEELRIIKNKREEEGAFLKDKSELLSTLNILHTSVIQLKTREGQAPDRTNIATDTKSAQSVIEFALNHMFEMNERLVKLDEIANQTDLPNKGTDVSEDARTNTAMLSRELHESINKELEQLKIDNVTLRQKLKDLEANQTINESTSSAAAEKTNIIKIESELQSKNKELEKLEHLNVTLKQKVDYLEKQCYEFEQVNNKIDEQFQSVCKEKDELKHRIESIEPQFNQKEKDVEKMKIYLFEKEKEISKMQQDRDNRIHSAQQLHNQLDQKNKTISQLQRVSEQQKESNKNNEEAITALRKEKDDLQTRLSSVAGEKLTKGNPSITDLGDPNRPMKISEKYGELYDNEWTDAMDNNKAVKECYKELNDAEIEEIIICHLHRLLKVDLHQNRCCYKDCLENADEQMQTLGRAFAETMCITVNSGEVLNMPVCKEASVFRRAKSVEYAKYLFENQIVDEMTAILHNLWKEEFCIMFLSRWSAVMLGLKKYETKLQEMNILKFKETKGILLKTESGVRQYFRNKIIKDDSLSTCLCSDSDVSEFETVNDPHSSVHYDISDDEVLEDGFVNIVQLQKDDGNEKPISEELKYVTKEIERLKKGTDELIRTREKTAEGKLEILRPLNPSEESIVHMGSRILLGIKDSLPTDSSSISDVVDFVLDHISKLNGNLASIQYVLQIEKDKLEDLTITQTETNRTNKQLKHVIEEQKKNILVLNNEIKSRKEQRQRQEDLNDDVNNKFKELQERTRRYQLEKNQTEERYQLACKEKDDLKLRIQQAFYQINQKEKAITDLEKMNRHQKDTIIAKEEVITVLRKEKDDLQTRLSSVAGEKLTKGKSSYYRSW